MGRFWHGRVILVAASMLAACSPIWACRTPVYRYAMYNWQPAPYRIYCFYRGELSADDRRIQAAFPLRSEELESVNAVFRPVNLDDPKALAAVPKIVRRSWEEQPAQRQTGYLVFTPWGTPLISGELTPAMLPTLIDSPARQNIAQALHEGAAGVLVLLEGQDKAKNRQAAELIDKAIKAAGSGRIPIATATGEAEDTRAAKPGDEDRKSRADEDQVTLKLARVNVAPDDRDEKWVLRMLMQSEEGLDDYAGEPMVFMCYGRGRVMPPLVGKGVTADNLADCIAFIGGACSCQVKDENPGADLLIRWDWEATAQRLADEDPESDDRPGSAADLMPPSKPAAPKPDKPQDASTKVASTAAPAEKAASAPPAEQTPAPAAAESTTVAEKSAPPPSAPESAAGGTVDQQLWTYGLGLAAALVVVVIIGLFLRKPG